MKGKSIAQKGLIFSIATILLLSALLGFARLYHDSLLIAKETSATTFYGDQMRFFEDDILDNVYYDLMGTNVHDIDRSTATITINISQALNSSQNDYEEYFSDYKNFIENNFSGNNYNFTLTGFDNSFNITPYDIKYSVILGRLYIYTTDITNLVNITVSVTVDTDLVSTQASTPDDDKNDATKTPIEMYYYRQDGTLIDSLTDRDQNPNENNDPYQQTFKDVPNQDVIEIDVEYGTYSGIPGVLQVYLHNANNDYNIAGNASIQLTYLQGSPVEMFGGDLTMTSAIDGLTRTFTHILKKE